MPFRCLDPSATVKGNILHNEEKIKAGKILRSQGSIGIAVAGLDMIGQKLLDENGNAIEIFRPSWWPSDGK
jgi:hypothetical protein